MWRVRGWLKDVKRSDLKGPAAASQIMQDTSQFNKLRLMCKLKAFTEKEHKATQRPLLTTLNEFRRGDNCKKLRIKSNELMLNKARKKNDLVFI